MEVGNLTVPVSADLGPLEEALSRVKKMLEKAGIDADNFDNSLGKVENRAKGMSGVLGTLAKQLAGVFAVKELVNFTDTWSDLSSRVGIAVGNMDLAPAVLERIAQTARMSYSNLNLTAEGFVRNSTVLKELGLSTKQQLDYQEALNNAMVVSGARGRAAEFVQESLNRSMALGKMRGMELNNVLNYGGRVAELLAEHFNTTTGGLMRLAQEGKITGNVLQQVLLKNMAKLREEAESMPATIGDGFTLIANALLQTIGIFDQANGLSETLAESLIWVADNMKRLVTYVATGAVGWAAYAAIVAATNAGLFTMSGALTLVRAGLLRIGIGAVVVAAGELVYQLLKLVEATGGWGNTLKLLGDVAKGVWAGIVTSASSIPLGLQAVWLDVRADFSLLMRDLGREWNNFISIFEKPALTVSVGGKTFELIGGLNVSEFKADLGEATTAAAMFRNQAGSLRDEAKSLAVEGFDQAREALAKLNVELEKNTPGLDDDGGPSRITPGIDKKAQNEAERLKKAYQDLLRDGRAFVAQQEVERQAIGLTEVEAAKLRYEFDLLNQAQRAGIKLTPQQTEELKKLAVQMAEAEESVRLLQERYDFAKDTFKGFFGDLKSELQNGASIWEAFGNAAANALQKIADKALDMALNGIFDMIFGAFFGGGGTTSFASGILNGSRVGLFANGTSYAPGGMAVVGERGPELLKLPGGSQVIPNNRVTAPAQASFGGGSGATQQVSLDISLSDDLRATVRQEAGSIVQVAIHDYDTNQLPNSVERVSNHPRMR